MLYVENTQGVKDLYLWKIANEFNCRHTPYDYPVTDANNIWAFIWERDTNLDFATALNINIRNADDPLLIPSITPAIAAAFTDYVIAEDTDGERYLYFRGLVSSGGLGRFVIGIEDAVGNEMLSYFAYQISDPTVFSLDIDCGGNSVEIGSTILDAYDCAGLYYGTPQNVIDGNANLLLDNTTEVWGTVKNMPANHQIKKFNNCKVKNIEFSKNIKIQHPATPEEVKDEVEYILSNGTITIDGSDWLLDGSTSFEVIDVACFCMYEMLITLKSCPCNKTIGCGTFTICQDLNGVQAGSVVTFADGTVLNVTAGNSVSYLTSNGIVSIQNAISGFLSNIFGVFYKPPAHTNNCQCFITVTLAEFVPASGCTATANLIIDGAATSVPITANLATTFYYPLGTVIEFVSLTVGGVTGTSTSVNTNGWQGYYSINGDCVASVDSLCFTPPVLGNPLRLFFYPGAPEIAWTLAQWNSNLFGGGTPFTSSIVTTDSGFTIIELYGGANVTMSAALAGSGELYGIEDYYGVITSAVIGALSNCTAIYSGLFYGLTAIPQSFMSGATNTLFGVIGNLQFPVATSIGVGAFFNSEINAIYAPLVTTCQQDAFAGSTIGVLSLPLTTGLGPSACAFCPNLTIVLIPVAIAIGNNCFNNCTGLDNIYAPNVVNFGGTAGNNNVFDNIFGITMLLTVPTILQTINGGSPDGDLVALLANNPAITINYV